MTFKGKACFITGENVCIDGGMTRNVIYHSDFGWRSDWRAEGSVGYLIASARRM